MPPSIISMFFASILLAVSTFAASAQAIREGYGTENFIADLEKNTTFFGTPLSIDAPDCVASEDGHQACTYGTAKLLEIITISDATSQDVEQVSIELPDNISPVMVLNIFASMASAVGPEFTGDELQTLWEDTFYQASALTVKGEAATKTLHGIKFTTRIFQNREIIFRVSR